MTRKLLLLCNPTAAGGRAVRRLPEAEAELRRLGADFRTVQTLDPGHARELAAEAAGAGETVAALGGDGFLRLLAGTLRYTDGALAVLPAGRGNDFARVLGISNDVVEAVRTAVQGTDRMIDVAEAGGEPYLGIASLGFDSDANRIANESRVVRGNLVYLYAALRALWSWKSAGFTVTVDGEVHELRGYSVAVANSKAYGGGMYIAPQAELDDGLLDVISIGETSKPRWLMNLPSVFRGRHVNDPSVTVLRGGEVSVSADRPFRIYADGDPIGDVPLTMTVRPRCLRVVVPA
ncbi:MAG: diacylglycerol kinase family protein [Thermoleophilaceae bacterium]